MCDHDPMEKIHDLEEQLKDAHMKIEAIAQYLKMSLVYTPSSYDLVKPDEVGVMPAVPMKVR